jgi:hypothetical protein
VTAFLGELARSGVSASTQNPALSALLFLYQSVIRIHLPWMADIVRAHAVARPAFLGQLAMQAIATRAGLVHTPQLSGLALQATQEAIDVDLARPDLSPKHRRLGPPARGMRDGDRILVDIQPDKQRSRLGQG